MKRALLVVSLALACTRTNGGAGVGVDPPPPKSDTPPTASDTPPKTDTAAPIQRDDRVALAAALKAVGVELHEEDCAVWPPTFPRVVMVGSFAHDRGCDLSGMLIDGKWITADTSVAGLKTAGFAAAAPEERQRLARAWVGEVEQGFGDSFVGALVGPPEFAFKVAGVAYTPVAARIDGPDVVVEGWVSDRAGMRYEFGYALVTYRFAPDGALKVASTKEFRVDGERVDAAKAAAEAKPAAETKPGAKTKPGKAK